MEFDRNEAALAGSHTEEVIWIYITYVLDLVHVLSAYLP